MCLLFIGSIFKLVYSSSEVEKKVTLFCIIYKLVLLTHIYICIFGQIYLDKRVELVDGGSVINEAFPHLVLHKIIFKSLSFENEGKIFSLV